MTKKISLRLDTELLGRLQDYTEGECSGLLRAASPCATVPY